MSREEDELRYRLGELAARQEPGPPDVERLRRRLRRSRANLLAAAAGGTALVVLAAIAAPSIVRDDDADRDPVTVVAASDSPSPAAGSTAYPQTPTPSPSLVTPPPLTASTGMRLLVVQHTTLQVLDVDSGATRTLPTDPRIRNHDRLHVEVVGDQLVIVGDNQTGAGSGPFTAFATTDGPGSPLRPIGEASSLAESMTRGRVWLHTYDYDTENAPRSFYQEVDLGGRVHRDVAFSGVDVRGPFSDGFVRYGNALVDDKGMAIRDLPGNGVVETSARHAVMVDDGDCSGTCTLYVVDAETFAQRSIQVMSSVTFGPSQAEVSPDARFVFYDIDDAPDSGSTRVGIGNLDTGEVDEPPQVRAAKYHGANPVFSADGRWVVFIAADGEHLDAYDVVNHAAYRVPGQFGEITEVVAL